MVAVFPFGPTYVEPAFGSGFVSIALKPRGGGAAVTTYNASGTASQPITVKGGYVSFYAPSGLYRLEVTRTGGGVKVINVEVAATPATSADQPADSDLTTIAAIDSSSPGVMATDGSGWFSKTYAQLKSALTLAKADVGLSNVDNTSDANKPVSTVTQAALDAKAPLASPAFTGTPTAPTPSVIDSSTSVATTAYTQAVAPFVNAKSVGLKGDGSTDETAAFTAALAAFGAGGGTLHLPMGTYAFSTDATFTVPSNVRLTGVGKNASVLNRTVASTGPLLSFSGTANAVGNRCTRGGMADLKINANSTTGVIVRAKWADHLNFDRVWFYGANDSAVVLENVWDSYFSHCEFEWCSGTNGLKPSVLIMGETSDSSNIIGFNECRWESFSDGALWVSSRQPTSAYTMVTGANPPYGIYLQNCKMETTVLRGYFFMMSADIEVLHVDGMYMAARGLYTGITTGRQLVDLIGASEITFKRIRVRVAGATNPTVKSVFRVFTNAPDIVIEDVVVDAQQALGASTAGSGGGIIEWAGGTPEARVQGVRYKSGQSGTIDFGSGTNPRFPTVASAATITVGRYSQIVNVTGTTGITSITAGDPGQRVTLKFAGALTVTDGGNLALNGNFTTAAGATLTLVCDGTNWNETSRSSN